MPLSRFTRGVVADAIGSQQAANVLCNLIDSGPGTVSAPIRRRLNTMFGSRLRASAFIAKVQSSSALSGTERAQLAQALGHTGAANQINAELST